MLANLAILLCLLLPVLAWRFRRRIVPPTGNVIVLFIVAWLGGTLLYIGSIRLIDWERERDLKQYDLDENGEFSPEEYTPEAQAAMKRYANDTGRSFTPVIAPLFNAFWVAVNFTACAGFSRLWRARKSASVSP